MKSSWCVGIVGIITAFFSVLGFYYYLFE